MLNDDIIKAQRIVSGVEHNFGNKDIFHSSSAVYKVSNERIQDYVKYFNNRNMFDNFLTRKKDLEAVGLKLE